MTLSTKGFESLEQLNRHFSEHGDEFRASNASEYERLADEFLGGENPMAVHECVRASGAKLRYDPSSEAFGVLDATLVIRTYYKPIPCSSVPWTEREQARRSGRCHQYRNNLAYFKAECQR